MIEWADSTHAACKRTTDQVLLTDYATAVLAGETQAIATLGAQLDAADAAALRQDLGRAARFYATRWGWPVFPCRPGDKTPLTEHGFADATTDPAVIRAWWLRWPEANIGVATGHRFDVLDVDWLTKTGQRTGAAQTWPTLRDSGELPDIHGVGMTARGGLHILFEPQGVTTIRAGTWKGVKVPGLDYRGRGGYVIAAPSRAPHGRWSWIVRPSPRITGQPDEPAATATRSG